MRAQTTAPGRGHTRAAELRFLLANGQLAAAAGDSRHRHLHSAVCLSDYARIADEVAALGGSGPLLDWGCGYGQMSYLLARRGVDVVAYDVGGWRDPALPMTRGLTIVRGDHPSDLPFEDGTFAAVLSCGVLEHVADEDASLRELRRVLIPGGRLLIYNLPQKASYKELVIRSLRLGWTHERRYTLGSIRTILCRNGFGVTRVRHGGVLPHLCTGLPPSFVRFYERFPRAVIGADRALSRLPPLGPLAQSLEIVAEAPRLSRRAGGRALDARRAGP